MTSLPDVGVVVLNFNGKQHLDRCLSSIEAQHYPRSKVQILLVDNDSTDGSVDHVRRRFGDVRIEVNPGNLGYAAAINRAVRGLDTPYIALLNNDACADEVWLERLVEPLLARPACAVTASKVLSWDGKTVHFAGGGCNFHGIGFQVGQGEKHGPEHEKGGATLFGCGAAMAFRRDVFLDLGGFDESYFAYYEDVDFGWRCWVTGHEVLYVPGSMVRHHHSATSVRIPIFKLRVLHQRNPLLTIFKNFDDANLARALPAALLVSLKRTWYLSGLDSGPFRIGPKDHHQAPLVEHGSAVPGQRVEEGAVQSVPMVALADLVAFDDLTSGFEALVKRRRAVQGRRERPDREILPLFLRPFWEVEAHASFSPMLRSVIGFFGLDEVFGANEE